MPGRNLQKSSQTRLFLIEDRAGPANKPSYEALARALGLTWDQGAITPIRIPDPSQYGRFVTVDKIKGQQGLPTISLEKRLERDLSALLALVRKGCDFDIQLHAGVCEDPRDFNQGWEKVYVFEAASATSYSTGELGALDADQNVPVNETVPVSGEDYYELKRIQGTEVASTQIVQEVVGVCICDSRQCGECGIPSDGCEKVFAVTKSHGGSPGLPAEVIYTPDGGTTIGETNVTTLLPTYDPTGIACVGTRLVVISAEKIGADYANTADVLNHVETWTSITTGFVAAHGPASIFSLGSTLTWIVGAGGYIYFSSDITGGVVVQSAGTVSVNDLNDVHGVDEMNLICVGAANTVLVTRNGGDTWTSITGPAPAVILQSCFMKSENEWFVGTATGVLYYTRDGGVSWTTKAFPGSGTGSIKDIQFATNTVGYMAHNATTPRGRILRTIDGGYSWYALPEAAGYSLPQGDSINAVAACSEDPNLVWGGGLADNATDGILLRVS